MKAIKERPILFNAEMRKAIDEGRKTQTRRIMKPQPAGAIYNEGSDEMADHVLERTPNKQLWHHVVSNLGIGSDTWRCPYGKPGDILYVKEPHYLYGGWYQDGKTKTGKTKLRFKCFRHHGVKFDEPFSVVTKHNLLGWFKRTPLFMPAWAARRKLLIEDIRAEPVQDIGRDDAINEGLYKEWDGTKHWYSPSCNDTKMTPYPKIAFKQLWDSINAPRGHGWDVNDYVWAVTFKKIEEGK